MVKHNTEVRLCTKCKIEKPATLEFFDKHYKTKDGLTSWCKDCSRESCRVRNRNNYVPKPKAVNVNDMLTRICTQCQAELPQNELFFRRRKSRDKMIYLSTCKTCEIAGKRQRRIDKTEGYLRELEANKTRHRLKHRTPEKRKKAALKTREWYRANKDRAIQTVRRRRAITVGSYTADELQGRYEQQDGKCYWCGADISHGFERDHVIPVSKGGTSFIDNIVCACKTCNRRKSDMLPSEWLEIVRSEESLCQ